MSLAKYVLFAAGVAVLVYGVGLIYRPAGLIVGGLLCVGVSLLIDKSQDV